MSLRLEAPSPLDHFACLVGHDAGYPLIEVSASLAHIEDPEVSLQDVLCEMDLLVQRLQRQVPHGASAMQRTFLLNEFFYEKLGFAADVNDFANPDNSFLHRVLERRRGIPISLAVLWMELAYSIGLKVDGISFPGHFLVKVHVDEGLIIQDPLTGLGMSQERLHERLEPFRSSWGVSEDEMAPLHLFLQAASGREITERMLRNLKNVYVQSDDRPLCLLGVLDRLLILNAQDWGSMRDRGLVRAQLGLREAAIQDLQAYVRNASAPLDLPVIEAQIELLRAAL